MDSSAPSILRPGFKSRAYHQCSFVDLIVIDLWKLRIIVHFLNIIVFELTWWAANLFFASSVVTVWTVNSHAESQCRQNSEQEHFEQFHPAKQ